MPLSRLFIRLLLPVPAVFGAVFPLAAQACHAGGHAGIALTSASLPLGNLRDDPTRGLGLGLDLGCELGAVDLGVRPEMAAMGSIMAWSVLGSVGTRFPRVARGPWLRLSVVGGLLLADDGVEGVNVDLGGPRVHVPQTGPLIGGSLRAAFPSTEGSSFYIEASLRVGFLDQVLVPAGEDDGDRTLVYWPLTVGYSFAL